MGYFNRAADEDERGFLQGEKPEEEKEEEVFEAIIPKAPKDNSSVRIRFKATGKITCVGKRLANRVIGAGRAELVE